MSLFLEQGQIMSTYNQDKMMNLVNDFSLFYIEKKGKLWISLTSIKKKIIINPRFVSFGK